MKKVLIAIDYHPVSEQVAKAGQKLAKQLGAEICLIHVESELQYYNVQYPMFMGYEAMPLDSVMVEEIQKRTEDYLETAAKHLNDENIKTHLAEGDTANAILDYAKEWNANIIVMGTHSHSIIEKLMGTVASEVLEKTEIPVFMVPIKK